MTSRDSRGRAWVTAPAAREATNHRFRLAFDTGGTFTDLTIDGLTIYKAPTTPQDPIDGVLAVCDVAAAHLGMTRRQLLDRAGQVVYGTTHATNAVISGNTAKTALLVTEGHPDILLWREGGRVGTFDLTVPFPEPYVPRRLTFEIRERIGPQGEVLIGLDEAQTVATLKRLRALDVEAVAVCLLWSIVNPSHERRVRELMSEHLPQVPVTLGHELNPTIREYRRASACAIDASLKPLMADFLRRLGRRLSAEGFAGRVLVMTSAGGTLDVESVADAPIHTLASGPAAAPIAGRHFLAKSSDGHAAIVTDAGGTSFDVSLIRQGRIPSTKETRIGRSHYGPMTGFPSIDVKSVGAGGGSIAWLDGSILRVGPESAGAVPGPACYGAGGTRATVTDACVVLGYLDPQRFLGGRMSISRDLAERAVRKEVAEPLHLVPQPAAAAVLQIACERMINAIEDIALSHGVDPREATIVCGGGSGGFYASTIARRLGCGSVIVPEPGAALSAVGVFISDLVADYAVTMPVNTSAFPHEAVNRLLEALGKRCEAFMRGQGEDALQGEISYSVEARYPNQLWDLDVPLLGARFADAYDVERLSDAFHRVHEEVLGIADRSSHVEVTTWHARARCFAGTSIAQPTLRSADPIEQQPTTSRGVYFPETGVVEAEVVDRSCLSVGEVVRGPAIIESGLTTLVLEPGATASRDASGSVRLAPATIREQGPSLAHV